ncbi:MAG: hypothetical protein JWR68_1488 [Polaromonas sp.]|nr:hypothetical protein [Polaromonas sp.]
MRRWRRTGCGGLAGAAAARARPSRLCLAMTAARHWRISRHKSPIASCSTSRCRAWTGCRKRAAQALTKRAMPTADIADDEPTMHATAQDHRIAIDWAMALPAAALAFSPLLSEQQRCAALSLACLERMDHGFEGVACWRCQTSGSMAEIYGAWPSGHCLPRRFAK